jgi:hypothetical protein
MASNERTARAPRAHEGDHMDIAGASRTLIRVAIACLAILALPPFVTPARGATPPATNQLQDLPVFTDRLGGTWSGGDLVAPDGLVPIDTAVTYQGLPSLRYEIRDEPRQWWWQSILALGDWSGYSLEAYRRNGFLEFNVKGAVGGEEFNIGLADTDPARSSSPPVRWARSPSFVTVTTEWQHVRIPLSQLIQDGDLPPAGLFNPRQVQAVQLAEIYEGPYGRTFWLNDIRFTSPDREPSAPPVRVNEVGYLPLGEKYAYVAGFPEVLAVGAGARFEVRRAQDDSLAYAGQLKLVAEHEAFVSGEKVLRADFSALVLPGRYSVRVEGLPEASPAFEIGWRVYKPMLRDALRYYFYQRQGIALAEPFAEGFARGLGHPGDATALMRSSGAVRDVSQGWYDAGDYGKYVAFAAGAVVDLVSAYEAFPGVFGDANNIPESGNGKPDVLDEIKWELDWMLEMQDSVSGGFYHLVYPMGCSGSCRPEDITDPRYVEDLMGGVGNVRPTATTAKAVAALAHASLAYREYDHAYAGRLLGAAKAGWAYLAANPQNIPATGFNGEQASDDEDRLWAAAELFRATRDPAYGTYFLARYQSYESVWTSTTDNAAATPMRAFLAYFSAPGADRAARRWFSQRFEAWKQVQLARTEKTWRNFLDDGSGQYGSDYYWGSNSVTLQEVVVIALGQRALEGFIEPGILKVARRQLNYVLGINPLRKSYVTGYGVDAPKQIFSSIYGSDGIDAVPPGILVEGPNQYEGWKYSRFVGRCYVDTNTDWAISEQAIYFNANLVFVLALADATGWVPSF